MFRIGRWLPLVVCLPLASCTPSAPEISWSPPEILVPGSSFHGIHGLTFDSSDRLYAGSVVGQAVYRIDPESGAVETFKAPPTGMADDLEFSPDGELVWTSFLLGTVHAQSEAGELRVLADRLPGANSLAFSSDGRLFVSQVFAGDALWEIDLEGTSPPRLILDAPGGFNGFDVGEDGRLYGPLWFRGQVIAVDPDSGETQVIADGFDTPAAVNFDSRGNLWAIDTQRGEIYRIDIESGLKTLVATTATSLDNLAFDSNDRLFVTNMADNAILEIDTGSGEARTVVRGRLAVPAGIAIEEDGSRLHIADVFALREVDTTTGAVTDRIRMHAGPLEYPDGVSLAAATLWLSSATQNAIQRIDRDSGESLGFSHEVIAPSAILAREQDVLVATLAGDIVRLDLEGRVLETVARDFALPMALISAARDRILVTEAGAGRIVEFDLTTGVRTEIAADLDQPEGTARLADGRLVVAEVGLQSLLLIDPSDGSRRVLADGLPIGLDAPPGMPPTFLPTGVAVDAADTIYFSSDLENAIYVLRPQ